MWGSKHAFLGSRVHYAVLPTKTSLRLIQSIGRSPSLLSTCSQVFTTKLVNFSFLLSLVALILLRVSLSFIVRSHLTLILFSLWGFSCITLLHLRIQMRYTDLERIIWRRHVSPWCVFFLCGCGSCSSPLFIDMLMQPHLRIVPRLISGQGVLLFGHRFCARVHISWVFLSLHCAPLIQLYCIFCMFLFLRIQGSFSNICLSCKCHALF